MTNPLTALLSCIATFLSRPPRHDEQGSVIIEHLGIILLSIVALVVMFAAIQLLGVDIIKQVRTSLNLP